MPVVLTLDGYIRVSRVGGREGDTFISPDVQREQVTAWARLRGVTIAQWHTDLDVSGGTMNRPGLDALMQRVRDGTTGGVAVARLDRLSRASVVDALKIVEEVHDAGGQIAAVDLGIDPTTPFGEFAMTIMLALARMERRRIADQWRISRQRAVERGVHVASARPTGYLRRSDGVLEPHPDEAPAILEMFRRAAAGDSWTELAAYLTAEGVQGPYGPAQWVGGAIPDLIRNRVYLGQARSGEFVNDDAHEPLVSRSLWEAAQVPRGPRAPRSNKPAFLGGLLRCAGCRHLMKPDTVRVAAGRALTYRCRGFHSTGTCDSRAAVMGHIVDGHVEALLLAELGALVAGGDTNDVELSAAEQAAAEAEALLRAYRDDDRILAALGPDRYVEGLTKRAVAADEAHAVVGVLQAKRVGVGADVASVVALWPDMHVGERRKILAGMVDCVFIRSGRGLAIGERVHVFWRGQGPDDLPGRGRRVVFGPFVWPNDPPGSSGVASA